MLYLKYLELINKIEKRKLEKEIQICKEELEREFEKRKQNPNYKIVYHDTIGFTI